MSMFTPIVTVEGQAKIAGSIAGGDPINISHLAVGNGNGLPVVPIENQIGLVNEVDRVTVISAVRDNDDPTKIVVTATIPVSSGPYTIREVGVFTSDGKLFAIGAYPDTFKPTAAQGATVEVDVEFVIQVSETAQVTITVDPANLTSIAGMIRVPFIAVDNHALNVPPGSPVLGATYSIGAVPTLAWAGNAHALAQWNGSLWAIAPAPERTVIGDKTTGKYYRRTATGWAAWEASETEVGLIRFATAAETAAATRDDLAVSPKQTRRLINESQGVIVYKNPGTYTFIVPENVTKVEVELWGPGGAGGASSDGVGGAAPSGTAGAGGGGGGYSIRKITGLTPGQAITVVIGAGGAKVPNGTGLGGGTTSFGGYCSASGGGGGGGGHNNLAPGGSGGTGVGGDVNLTGGPGGPAMRSDAATYSPNDQLKVFNKGGLPPLLVGTINLSSTGADGSGHGVGGSGASGGAGLAGGNGAPGLAIVRW